MMKKLLLILPLLMILELCFTGCRHPSRKTYRIQLGFTPDQVELEMGRPYAVRSSKVFDGEETTTTWEYRPPFLSNNDQIIHVIFENGKVVQWGVAGDYQTGNEKNVREYKSAKP